MYLVLKKQNLLNNKFVVNNKNLISKLIIVNMKENFKKPHNILAHCIRIKTT